MKHILIVDDVAEVRRLVRLAIGHRHHVMECADASQALALLQQEPALDLLVLDIMLPGAMDGLQLLSILRSDPRLGAIRVVMLTARGAAEDQARATALQADAYFTKPFSPLAVADCIDALLSAPPTQVKPSEEPHR